MHGVTEQIFDIDLCPLCKRGLLLEDADNRKRCSVCGDQKGDEL
jgi:hypothetical protein